MVVAWRSPATLCANTEGICPFGGNIPAMANFGHLVSGAAWNIGGKFIQLGSSLVALAVIARLVGPEVYGIFALAWLVVGLFDVFVSSAPTDTLIQRKEISQGHLDATFWVATGMGVAIAVTVWYFAAYADRWLEGGALLAAILPWRAAVLPVQALAVAPTALLLRRSRFKALAGAETAASIVSNLAGVGMALAGAGVWSLVGMELVRTVVLCGSVYGLTRWRPGLALRTSHVGDLLAFNASTWGSWGLGYLGNQLPRFLLASTLGAQAVGFFALAQRLFDQVKNIVMIPAYQVVQAGIARAQEDVVTARRLTEGTLRVTGVVACPLFLGLAALAPILVTTVFGSSWTGAIPVVQIMMLLGVFASMSVVQAAVIRGMGKPHWEIGYEIVLVAVTALLLIPAARHGAEAAAAVVVVSAAVAAPVNSFFVRELTGLSIRLQTMAVMQAGLAASVMAVCVWAVGPMLTPVMPAAVALFLLVCLGALLYWALLRWSMPAAARIIQDLAVAAARRDPVAIRASLAGLRE
jgi:O-antigen/teichoic acid export membrane protein